MEGRPDIHKFLYQPQGGIPPSHCVVKTIVDGWPFLTCDVPAKTKGESNQHVLTTMCICVLAILVELAEQNRLCWHGRLCCKCL